MPSSTDPSAALTIPTRKQQDSPQPTASRMVGKQVVFRVKNPRASPRKTPRQPRRATPDGQTKEAGHHPTRKTHRKSRTGCGNCKKRRVKCDEGTPGCQKCVAYGIPCDYTDVESSQSPPENQVVLAHGAASDLGPVDIIFSTLSMVDLTTRVNNALRMGQTSRDGPGAMTIKPNSVTIVALRKFFHVTTEFGYMPDAHKKVICSDAMRLAFKTPYLMHAILGTATTSVGHILSDKSYKLPEAYHWQQAIRQYQQELLKPIGPHNMDALMSTCIFMSILSFSDQEYDPRDSFVFSDNPRALNWLMIQGGLRYLLSFTWRWLPESVWSEAFKEAEGDSRTFDDHRAGPEGLDPELAELCEIGPTTTEETNPYHWPLRMLAPLLLIQTNRYNFTKLCMFMGRLEPEYIALLQQKDPRALLIFSIWTGKMCEDDNYWAHPRFQSECTAVCMFLDNPNTDPRILKHLEWPAERCGYVLRHVVERVLLTDEFALPDIF